MLCLDAEWSRCCRHGMLEIYNTVLGRCSSTGGVLGVEIGHWFDWGFRKTVISIRVEKDADCRGRVLRSVR